MPRFTFPLQAVLEQRVRIEQDRQRIVAELELLRLKFEQQIRSCQRQIEAEQLGQREALASGDLLGARFQAAATLRLDAEAQRYVIELAGVHRRLESARAELLEAMKARKAVELLKERRFEDWRQQQARLEAAANDEISTMQAARRERYE